MKKTFNILFIFIFAFILINNFKKIDAVSSSIDSLAEEYTNSDEFQWNGRNYKISDYKDSIGVLDQEKKIHGKNVTYNNSGGIVSEATIIEDDAIVNIIPRELFTKENDKGYLYIGLEYGFYILTYKEEGFNGETSNFHSRVIVFDIIKDFNQTDIGLVEFKVSVLFQLEYGFITNNEEYFYRRKSSKANIYNLKTNYILENINNCVVPFIDPLNESLTSDYYLSDISFAAKVNNEQDLNLYDNGYTPEGDIGSFFTRMDYIYDGIYKYKDGMKPEDWNSVFLDLLSFGLGLIDTANILGAVDTVFSISKTFSSKLSEKMYDISNNSNIMKALGNTRDQQILKYKNLIKSCYAYLNTNTDISVWYNTGNFAKVIYSIANSAVNTPANYTRLNNEIALKIVDVDGKTQAISSSSNKYMIEKPVEKEIFLEKDSDLILLNSGVNHFYYQPIFNATYILNFADTKGLKIEINNQTYEGNNSIQLKLRESQRYRIIVTNNTSEKIIKKFKLTVREEKNDIQVDAYSSYLVKISNNDGFRQISYGNLNATIILYNSLFSENDKRFNDTNNISALLYSNMFYYIVIINNTNVNFDSNLTISEIKNGIDLTNPIDLDLIKGDNFSCFTPLTSGRYQFFIKKNSDSKYNFKIFTDYYDITPSQLININYMIYECDLNANEKIYLGYINCDKTNGTINIEMFKDNLIFEWYKGNDIITNNTLYLNLGEVFVLTIKINGKIITPQLINLAENVLVTNNYSIWEVKTNALFYADNQKIMIDSMSNVYRGELEIILIPKIDIVISINNSNEYICNSFNIWLNKANFKQGDQIILKGKLLLSSGDYDFEANFIKDNFITIYVPEIISYQYNSSMAKAEIYIDIIEFTQITDNGHRFNLLKNNNNATSTDVDKKYQFNIAPTPFNALFSDGNGTLSSPYKIINGWQLNNMRYMAEYVNYNGQNEYMITGHYLITNDIRTPDTHYFEPMPYLNGSLKGNGKPYISIGKLCTGSRYYGSGLFKSIYEGVVSSMTIEIRNEENSSGGFSVVKGVLAGYIIEGEVFNVTTRASFTTESVNGINSIIGGIAGIVSYSSLSNCESFVKIKTYGDAGGIAGNLSQGSINFCTYNGYIEYFYNAGSISNENNNKGIGGIVGMMYGSSSSIRGCSVYSSESSKILIAYKSSECNDTALKPCIGFIIGRKTNGSTSGNMIASNLSINKGSLKKFKPSLFGSTYIQYDWVATGTNEAGRVG